jgi:glycosyltransferase involved in cell wall biosynthesis
LVLTYEIHMASNCPVASVVVSAHNSAAFIGAAVESVLRQTLPDLEVIVVDDGSTDGTVEVLRCYNDGRLRVVHQESQGSAGTANTGIRLSRGTYVGFLDGDDIWRKTKLACHVRLLEQHPELDLTFSWSRLINEAGQEMSLHSRHWRGAISAEELFVDFVIANGSSAVVRRAALDQSGGLDPELPLYCDMDLCLRLALLRPGNACAVPGELTFYRRRRGQLSRDCAAMHAEWERMIEKFARLAPEAAARGKRHARSNMSRYFAFLAYESRDYSGALGWLLRAFRCCPARFLAEKRNWQLSAAASAGFVLPAAIHQSLERIAGVS